MILCTAHGFYEEVTVKKALGIVGESRTRKTGSQPRKPSGLPRAVRPVLAAAARRHAAVRAVKRTPSVAPPTRKLPKTRAGATPTSLDAKACTTRTAAAEVLSRRTDGGSDDKLCVANRSWACDGSGAPASDADLVRAVEAMRPALLPVGVQVRK